MHRLAATVLVVSLLLFFPYRIPATQGQSAPITSSGLNTVVTQNANTFNITGGTRPGGVTNLFHSFGNFSVPNTNIANFLNSGSVDIAGNVLGSGLPTSNILGRVTGGNPSSIFGTIQTNGVGGFGNANLFLMNPAGVIFGPTATLNVGGMAVFTTADYLKLTDGKLFHATTNSAADALLSTAPVAAFGFLGSNPGAITLQGSQLTVADGTGISLVGGNITIQRGTLEDGTTMQGALLIAPGGHIQLASVSSPGEIVVGIFDQAPNVNGQSFGALGTIQISQESVINTTGPGGGTIRIRGGQFRLDHSTIAANGTGPGPVTTGVETIGSGIDIQASQSALIENGSMIYTSVGGADIFPSTLLTTTRGEAHSADLNITAHDILLTGGSTISTETFHNGDAGTLNIRTNTLQLFNGGKITSNSRFNPFLFPGEPSEIPLGAGGTIAVQGLTSPAQSVLIDGQGSGIFTNTEGTGAGGNMLITANSLTLQNGGTISTASSGTALSAIGGTITLNALDHVAMSDSVITARSTGLTDAGDIVINAGRQLVLQNSSILADASQAGGGNITIQAVELLRAENSTIGTLVLGSAGGSGNITIDPNSVVLLNSQIFALAVQGPGGNISITTNLLLFDTTSVVSASSGINVQSPIAPAGGKIVPLSQELPLTRSLLSERCAHVAQGEISTFTVINRDSLPSEPSDWLTSPLPLVTAKSIVGTLTETGKGTFVTERQKEVPILSFRQIARLGFLTQGFGVETSGCSS